MGGRLSISVFAGPFFSIPISSCCNSKLCASVGAIGGSLLVVRDRGV